MYDAVPASQFDVSTAARMQRVKAEARVSFRRDGARTRLDDLYQSGAAKLRLPKVHDAPVTAVLINTAGGLTGGDSLSFTVSAGPGAHAIVTSQTAERAYLSSGGSARVAGRFVLEEGARIDWLPQETILFDGSSLRRSLDAELAGDARLMLLESVIVGRAAMGEKVSSLFYRDSWRVRRDGRLVFADDIRLDGEPAPALAGRATARGGIAAATFADCAPHAGDRLDLARKLLDEVGGAEVTDGTRAAASALDGVLVARFVAPDGRRLRRALMTFLIRYRAADLPRVWHC